MTTRDINIQLGRIIEGQESLEKKVDNVSSEVKEMKEASFSYRETQIIKMTNIERDILEIKSKNKTYDLITSAYTQDKTKFYGILFGISIALSFLSEGIKKGVLAILKGL